MNIPEIEGLTQARNLAEVEEMARDYIAVWLDIPASSFAVNVTVDIPPSVNKRLQFAAELREAAASSQAHAAQEVRLAAMELKQMGMPLRDVGAILGVSYQRAHQLVTNTAS